MGSVSDWFFITSVTPKCKVNEFMRSHQRRQKEPEVLSALSGLVYKSVKIQDEETIPDSSAHERIFQPGPRHPPPRCPSANRSEDLIKRCICGEQGGGIDLANLPPI